MTESSYPIQGGCSCGAIRYQLESEPMFVHCCHCTQCQRETGSAFTWNAEIETDRITLLRGEPKMTLLPSPSGNGQELWRCPKCLVVLWGISVGFEGKKSFVYVGTLDTPDLLPPRMHIFTSTKQDWVIIPPDHATAEEFYELECYWSKQDLARRRQLLEFT